MRRSLAFLSLVLAVGCACPSKPGETAAVAPPAASPIARQIVIVTNPDFSRYLMVTVCYKGHKDCIGPVVKNLEQANVKLQWENFSKGYVDSKPARGVTAVDKVNMIEGSVPFTSEIRVTKHDGKKTTSVYMMLRSGAGTKREGKVKTFEIPDLAQLKETKLSDEPIEFEGGTLKAELVVGPPLNLTL
ncbi:MAG: hypothetical protein V4760_14365 [Bdellovibrionota bacterium]